jgi:hypothetical protein
MQTISMGRIRRGLIVASLSMTVLVAMPAAALAAGPSDPFIGSYRAIDTSFDGSNMLLSFGGADQHPNSPPGPEGIRRVIWLDDFATVCGGGRFFAEGVGFVDGDTTLVFFEIYCGNGGTLIGEDVVAFTFDPADGTLTDTYDTVWSRP